MSKCTCYADDPTVTIHWCSQCDDQPLAIHQPPALLPDPQGCTCANQPQWCDFCLASHRRIEAAWVAEFYPPKDNCVQQPPKPQLSEKQEREGQGIARAVKNLTFHESRLGASRWHP
jgi:hypothetical protein